MKLRDRNFLLSVHRIPVNPFKLPCVLSSLAVAMTFSLGNCANATPSPIVTWSNTATAGGWLTGVNWVGGSVPGGSDVAQFTTNPAGAATVGIDFAGATNNGAGNQIVGGIEIATPRATALTINNSSTTPGILTLNGANVVTTVGGGETANVIVHQNAGGNITITNGAGAGTMGINLPNPTNVIAIDTNFQVVIGTAISGPGGVTLMRNAGSTTARLDFRAANTYQGDTNLQSGLLRARVAANIMPHGPGTGNLNIASGATFSMDLSNTVNGLNDLGGGGGTVFTQDAASVVLTVGDNDANGSFSGTIASTTAGSTVGLTKIGNGTQTLSGANTYNGATTVNAGALIVNGTHTGVAGYTIAGGGTLGGSGAISAAVDLSGTLTPGTSPGTLTVGGLTLQNGSTCVFELVNTASVHAPGAGNDLIDINGALTGLAATTVNIDVDAIGGGELSAAGTWTLALYDSLAGTGIPMFNVTGVDAGYSYAVNIVPDDLGVPTGPGEVQLTLTAVPEPGSFAIMCLGSILGAAIWRRGRRDAK